MDDRLLFLISRAQHVLKNYLKNEFIGSGVTITPAQMGILFSLKKSDGMPMNELGKIISIDNAAVTRHVDNLEKIGLVSREQQAGDRRKWILRITDKGVQEAKSCAEIAHRVNNRIKEGHSVKELESFKRILNGFFTKFV